MTLDEVVLHTGAMVFVDAMFMELLFGVASLDDLRIADCVGSNVHSGFVLVT